MIGEASPKRDYRDLALRAVGRIPPVSPGMPKLLAELAHKDVSFAVAAKAIGVDPLLTGYILRRANSSLYSCRMSVTTVLHALTMLGLDDVRRMALNFSTERLWSHLRLPPGFSKIEFNLHSSATAFMAGLLVQRLAIRNGEMAVPAALLHDVSKVLVAIALPERFEMLGVRGEWEAAREMEVLGVTHGELSAAVLERWKLPPDILEAVARHHTCIQGARPPEMANVVCAADTCAAVPHIATGTAEAERCRQVLAGLGLEDQIPAIMTEFEAAWIHTRKLLLCFSQ